MKARLTDGSVATVVDVLIDYRERAARYVVLNTRGYFGPDVLVPLSAVWRVDDAVHLALTTKDLATLPCYDHYVHSHVGGLCSRSAWRYGTVRRHVAPASRAADA